MSHPVTRLVLAAAILAGCGSSPEPVYYALAHAPGSTRTGSPPLVELRKPVITGYLDRESIVAAVVGYRLELARGDRWAEPLGDMIGRVLAEDLSGRLPESTVFSAASEITTRPDVEVNVDVQRFEAGGDGQVVLRAEVALEARHGRPTVARAFLLHAPLAGAGTRALVASMSDLLGRLADAIAGMLLGV